MKFEQFDNLMQTRSDSERFVGLSMTEIQLLSEIRRGVRRSDVELDDVFEQSGSKVRSKSPRALLARVREDRERLRPSFQKMADLVAERFSPLAKRFGLCPLSYGALALFNLTRQDIFLRVMANTVPAKTRKQAAEQLAQILGGAVAEWRGVLSSTGPLVESGFIQSDIFENADDLGDIVQNSLDISEVLEDSESVEVCLLHKVVRCADPAKLKSQSFKYLKEDLTILSGLLSNADSQSQILLAGEPGVGKTELARALGELTGRKAMEIRFEDGRGKGAGRNSRLQFYQVSQRLVPDRAGSLLIFDEVEDVFEGEHLMLGPRYGDRNKAWINRLLESAQIPTIWITNNIDSIDPAYLRRFDHIVEMQAPPVSVRRKLLNEALGGQGLPAALLDRAAESPGLSPADIDRCARVLPVLGAKGKEMEAIAARLLSARPGSVPRAQLRPAGGATSIPYDIAWINADVDVASVIQGLRQSGRGTLGFFGPPGTGKTQLAKHIAVTLDRPLMIKRASDLLGAYLGQTEARIARAFEAAIAEDAILLLDEADSFLQDRSEAHRSWEITQVNELLSQLDGYGGIAILTSNFSKSFDPAVVRRIDVKVQFDYLSVDNAVALGRKITGGKVQVFEPWQGRSLCFGDFAAAMRGMSVRGETCKAKALVAAVLREIEARGGSSKSIGFMA